jgi:cell division septum initiation protein DivIVA
MPDQSSAAQEHALLEQITGPLATLPENPVATAADVDFPIALRGYDRIAVDAYVARTSQLIAELHATASPEGAIRRALERVGEEVSGVLQHAHQTASEVTTQSRAEAEDRLQKARAEAAQITADAREKLRTLDEDADRIWAERDRIIGDARDLARQLVELADAAGERFPAAEDPGGSAVVAVEPFDAELGEPEPEPEPVPAPEPVAAPPYEEPQFADADGEPEFADARGEQEFADASEFAGQAAEADDAEATAVLWPRGAADE